MPPTKDLEAYDLYIRARDLFRWSGIGDPQENGERALPLLEQAIARGDRVLLLITGHHRSGEPPVERGKIRAAVHDWLAASRHASSIAAVRGAHRRHGGGGSLYIILKRKPSRR